MNEIEQMFYNAWIECEEPTMIEHGKIIGPYKVDFFINQDTVVEIDGHEAHKTKEQRSKDYSRERFFQSEGYYVVRFMGTEVFLDSAKCVEDASHISFVYSEKIVDAYEAGVAYAKQNY